MEVTQNGALAEIFDRNIERETQSLETIDAFARRTIIFFWSVRTAPKFIRKTVEEPSYFIYDEKTLQNSPFLFPGTLPHRSNHRTTKCTALMRRLEQSRSKSFGTSQENGKDINKISSKSLSHVAIPWNHSNHLLLPTKMCLLQASPKWSGFVRNTK